MSAIKVKVPDIGDFSGVPVISVLVSVGDNIRIDDNLVELESDKATMEVPSASAGKVLEVLVAEGDEVSEGTPLILLETGETEASVEDSALPDPAQEDPAPENTAAGSAPISKREGKIEPAAAPASAGKSHASPSIRAFARELGVDLSKVSGSGRKGRILRGDVTAYFKSATMPAQDTGPASGTGIPPIPLVDFSSFGEIEVVEMSRIKKLSGPALHRSWLNIPHVTHNDEADITELDAFRREVDNDAKKEGYRITLLSFAIKASVAALKKHWEVNSSLHPGGGKLIRKSYYNIGFAADTPHGLMVPVVRGVDSKGIADISKDLAALSAKAREGKLALDEMSGATFTISSLGGIGGTSFSPIVNAPEVAILGLARSRMQPVWDPDSGKFVPRLMQPLSLSYDHRAIDGALAARFCVTLKLLLSDIRRLLF